MNNGALVRADGVPSVQRRPNVRLSASVDHHPYELGDEARPVFDRLGVDVDALSTTRRPLLRFCMDWTEQQHHLAGHLGAELLAAFLDNGWVTRTKGQRAVRLTVDGQAGLSRHLGIIDFPGR